MARDGSIFVSVAACILVSVSAYILVTVTACILVTVDAYILLTVVAYILVTVAAYIFGSDLPIHPFTEIQTFPRCCERVHWTIRCLLVQASFSIFKVMTSHQKTLLDLANCQERIARIGTLLLKSFEGVSQ